MWLDFLPEKFILLLIAKTRMVLGFVTYLLLQSCQIRGFGLALPGFPRTTGLDHTGDAQQCFVPVKGSLALLSAPCIYERFITAKRRDI